jgi:hypothetical protein
MVISGFWLFVACGLFGIGVVSAFAGQPEKAIAIALYGLLAMKIGDWTIGKVE